VLLLERNPHVVREGEFARSNMRQSMDLTGLDASMRCLNPIAKCENRRHMEGVEEEERNDRVRLCGSK